MVVAIFLVAVVKLEVIVLLVDGARFPKTGVANVLAVSTVA